MTGHYLMEEGFCLSNIFIKGLLAIGDWRLAIGY